VFPRRSIYLALIIIFVSTIGGKSSILDRHSVKNKEENTLLYADEIIHDKKTGIITARGHVEIQREGRVLRANVVTYNDKTDIMTASGQVRLDEHTGENIYVDYAELTGDLKNGFLTAVRMMLANNARLVASGGDRKNAEITHLKNVIYSPCNICKINPKKPPFWQLKSKHAVYDEKAEDIYYTDAFIEMFGIPAFYTPYLRHPSPKVKRRTGLLGLTLNRSTALGWYTILEYFWVLDKDKDITFMPLIRANGNGVLGAEYRQRLKKGTMTLGASIDPGAKVVEEQGKTSQRVSNKVRWHIAPEVKYDFTEHIRGGAHIERTSDQTYLRRYPYLGFSNRTFLTSNIYSEGFWGRSYGIVQGYSFQGLREGDQGKTTPLLLPWVTIKYLSKPSLWGGRWSIDGDGLALRRQEGSSYNRLSTTGGWQKYFISSWGEAYTLGAKLRGDIYKVTDYKVATQAYNSNILRVFPQAYAMWNYPYFRTWNSYRLIFEPLVGVVGAPNLAHPTKLPNEDSRFVEFNDAVLMSESRFAGLDRIDAGSRLNFGVNFLGFSGENGNAGLFLGQSFSFQQPKQYLAYTGLGKRLSDIVARIKYNYKDWISFRTRFLLDRSTFHFHRNETSFTVGQPILNLTTDYVHTPILTDTTTFQSTKQIRLGLKSKFHENWSAGVNTTRDLGRKSHTLSQGAELAFENECFIFSNSLTKTFYYDRDLRPSFAYMFRVSFKTLGEFSYKLGRSSDRELGSGASLF
jgi:LPS-assembly protein